MSSTNRRRSAALLNTTALVPVISALMAVSLIALPAGAQAQSVVIDDGMTESVNGAGGGTQASPWVIDGFLIVDGALQITNGGSVSTGIASNIGVGSGANGTVTVTGAGSTWAAGGSLRVGDRGTGRLTISDGGKISTASVVVANQSGSVGTINFGAADNDAARGAGTLDTPEIRFGAGSGSIIFNHTDTDFELAAAISGNGSLRQLAGTTILTGENTYIGPTTISGGTLQIGNGGATGTLGSGVVENNAELVFNRSNNLTVANAISGTGSLTQRGSGTLTLTGESTYTGETFIRGGTLVVGDGGTIDGSFTLRIALGADENAAMVVRGDNGGGTVNVSGVVRVGESGTGALSITNGGTVSSGSNILIGSSEGSNGTVTVDGTGSRLDADRVLDVGLNGSGTLQITNGGRVSTGFDSIIGHFLGSNGVATVDGAGSRWDISEGLEVARRGTGRLTISNGGEVSAPSVVVAGRVESVGTINFGAGDGETAIAAGRLVTPTISFGAGTGSIVFNHTDSDFTLGAAISGNGALRQLAGTTTLTGANTYTGLTTISGGTLALGADNAVPAASAMQIAGGTLALRGFSTGAASVNMSAGSITGVMDSALNVVGDYVQSGGTIEAGATVNVGAAGAIRLSGGTIAGTLNGLRLDTNTVGSVSIIGATVDSGSALVSGTMSLGSNLEVGTTGNGVLTIANGGTSNNRAALIGQSAGSNGSVVVTGDNSSWVNRNQLLLGVNGDAALTIEAGGSVRALTTFIGTESGSSGTALVTGAGSRFTNSGSLIVGRAGKGVLTVSSGGSVDANAVILAGIGGSLGKVVVSGPNSRLVSVSSLQVGSVADGDFTISNGGFVSSGFGVFSGAGFFGSGGIGLVAGASGAMLVTGVGSRWENSASVEVGRSGNGVLTISDGGSVTATNVAIGIVADSTGTINFGAAAGEAATGAGVLDTPTIAFGAGNGSIVFNHTDSDFTLGAAISGNGSLRQLAGTTILTGASEGFTGSTAVSGGRLLVTGALGGDVAVNGGTLGGTGMIGGAVAINDGGTLAAGQSPGTLTLGSLALNAGSTTVFELGEAGVAGGANNDLIRVTGELALNGGTINVVREAGFGSGQYTLFEFGSLSGALGNLALDPLGGGFVGNLALGDGTVLLNAASSADLVWWNGTTTSPTGAVVGGDGNWSLGAANFTDADGMVSGPWAGNGSLAVFGGSAGTVTIAAGETVAPSGLNFLTDGYVITGGDATSRLELTGPTGIETATGVGATIVAVISGEGSLTKTGGGTLTLTGENTYTGTTTIAAGVLQLGDGGTSGSILGQVVNHGVLAINRSDAVTLSNAISGTGMLVQDGTGTTTLTGVNTYSGGTLVSRGRLVGDTSSLQGAIENNAALEFAMGADGTFAGMLSGSGMVEKTGAGILSFAGNGSALTGPLAVLGGGLRLDGANGGRLDQSVVTLGSGTSLTGNGTIGGLVAGSGAVVSPGDSLGTITVAGDVTFLAGSRLTAEIGNDGADLISATGLASLAGALDIVNIGDAALSFNTTFTLLEAAGGIEGSFDTIAFTGFDGIFTPTLLTGPNALSVLLAPSRLADLAGVGLTGNQAAVAARFDDAVAAGFNPQDFFGVYSLAPADLAGALDQLSGEVHAGMGRAAMRQSRLPREAVLERAAGVALADNPQGNSWGGWGKLMRSWGNVSAESGSASQQTDTEGFVIGFDGGSANDSRALRFGIYGSYLNTRIAIDTLGSSGRIEQAGGGVYTSLALRGFSLVAGGGAARFDIMTDRAAMLPGLAVATSSVSAGDMAQLFGRMGYRLDLGAASIEPFVAGDHAWIALDQTTERGGAAALGVGRQEYKVAGATAGIAAKVPLGKLRIDAEAAARFELGDRTPEAMIALAAAPGQATRIAATRLNTNAFAGRLGAVLPLARRIEVRVDYSGEFSANDTEHAALAGLSIRF